MIRSWNSWPSHACPVKLSNKLLLWFHCNHGYGLLGHGSVSTWISQVHFKVPCFWLELMPTQKWPEVRLMSTTTVSKTCDVLREWFASHGIPELLVTDNGPQFTAEEFEIFIKQNGIKHVKSASYHPASNGLAERFIQSLKQSLKASLHDGRSLCQRLSSYLLTYCTTAHSTTGVPPCQLFTQRDLRTRFNLLLPNPKRTDNHFKSSRMIDVLDHESGDLEIEFWLVILEQALPAPSSRCWDQ